VDQVVVQEGIILFLVLMLGVHPHQVLQHQKGRGILEVQQVMVHKHHLVVVEQVEQEMLVVRVRVVLVE
tara:strand:- start:356 stop:562 length:207 start_codon:yes stop_codon:yes gene_type:complete